MANADANVPVVRFDDTLGVKIYPKPIPKTAVLVFVPQTQDGDELPVFISPEWGGVQVFYGSYYLVVNTTVGVGAYGSAQLQFMNMHTQFLPGKDGTQWVKTAIPVAYQADGPCKILTLIPQEDGSIRETAFVLKAGDWIVRQPGGEIQHIKAAKFGGIYYSQDESEALGLTEMTAKEFADWAVAQALASVTQFA